MEDHKPEDHKQQEEERLILKMLGVLMQYRHLSQRELGEQLAVITGKPWTQQKVWKVLNGKIDLTVDMLLHLCHAFHMPLVELIVKAQALRPMSAEVREYLAGFPLFVVISSPDSPKDPKSSTSPIATTSERSA